MIAAQADEAINRAFEWFGEVETNLQPVRFIERAPACRGSGRRLASTVSPMLFGALNFALEVAADTSGAFDPTVGRSMEARGFRTDYRTGQDAFVGYCR
jgi:thiamine biosynthesis lipoprotein